MLMNYHEMTMGTPRDDASKRTQFKVVCSVMVSVLVYSLMTSGALLPIDPVQGVFPGGYFCYKFTNRDYAASMGLGRQLQADFGVKLTDEVEEIDQITYHVYLDDPSKMGGRRQRWMTGIMVGDEGKPKIEQLQALNKDITPIPEKDFEDASAKEVFMSLKYELDDLPSVDALVLQFPFTNGFVSALMLSYRVST